MLPAGLSMLWESAAPGTALRERFGFESFEAAAAWCIDALRASWGVSVREVARVVISSQNVIVWAATDRGDVVIKWSRARGEFPRLAASTELLRMLADRGIPVAKPFRSLDGTDRPVLRGPAGDLSVAVLPELAGEWLDVNDDVAVRAAGASLAELHGALREISPGPVLLGGPVDLRARVQDWIAEANPYAGAGAGGSAGGSAGAGCDGRADADADDSADAGADEDAAAGATRDSVRRLAELLASAPPPGGSPQLVHNDYRAANILTRASAVAAILDFDDVVVTDAVYDVAKASVYLGTLFTDWGPTQASARESLREGYESVRPLTDAESKWFEILRLWLGLHAAHTQPNPEAWLAAL